jgi:hypothetical protein
MLPSGDAAGPFILQPESQRAEPYGWMFVGQ